MYVDSWIARTTWGYTGIQIDTIRIAIIQGLHDGLRSIDVFVDNDWFVDSNSISLDSTWSNLAYNVAIEACMSAISVDAGVRVAST